MHELPDKYLADIIALAKKIAIDQRLEDYNILQVRSYPSLSSIYVVGSTRFLLIRHTEQRKGGVPICRPRPLSRHSQTRQGYRA